MGKSFAMLLAGAASLMAASTASAAVDISYYNNYDDTGSSITFSGSPYATAIAPESSIQLGDLQPSGAINAAAQWPGGGVSFGADITEVVDITTPGVYNLSLTSDDGSYLFIDSALELSDGGTHAEQTVSGPVTLTAGLHDIEVQYYNGPCCGAGVELTGLPPSVPEPATWALMILGIGGIGAIIRREAKKTALATA
jgi:hypothetical protein